MQPNEIQAASDSQHRSLATVWLILLVSQGLFLAFCLIFAPEDDAGFLYTFRWVIFVLALTLVIDSFVFKSKILSIAARQHKPAAVNNAYILAFALSEATALFGFLLRFSLFRYYYILFAVAAIAMLLHFPRKEAVLAAYEA
ncbi:MAG TPA: hypothetical protein VFZ40_05915 [Pyrinomonadaceae bacterium]